MYLPPLFEETSIDVLGALMRAHPLATLVTLGADGLTANHIPMMFDADAGHHDGTAPALRNESAHPLRNESAHALRNESAPAPLLGTLRGHVARANPVWRDTKPGSEALAIFQGPSGYITPSWYATKKESGKVVPTWNYAVVHARGPLRVIDDPVWLRAFLEKLTARHEASLAAAWKVSDAPEDFIQSQLRAIVGIEIPLVRLAGKWKVSQNRPPADREGVIQGLRERDGPDDAQMADWVAGGRNGS